MSSTPNEKIWLSPPHMNGKELVYVQQAFAENWIAPVGPFIGKFEQALASSCMTQHCAALASGTAAIHLALIILGVQRDDEVICSSFTFSGSCNPVVYQGARPVFVDSERETWNMDPVLLEEAIVDRKKRTGRVPKAIILVHLYGIPARLDEILPIATRYEIPIIEDAAEALGSTYLGKPLGGFGQLGILSFNGNKIITTSGGGALLSNREEWIREARFLATQARDPAPHYEHSKIGYNYRLSNVSAAIGLGQLETLSERVTARRQIFERYKTGLSDLGIDFVDELKNSLSNRWLTTVQLDRSGLTPDSVRLALEANNIECRPLWKPMHLQPVFNDYPVFGGKVSEDLFRHGLCLPSGSSLSASQQDRIMSLIRHQK